MADRSALAVFALSICHSRPGRETCQGIESPAWGSLSIHDMYVKRKFRWVAIIASFLGTFDSSSPPETIISAVCERNLRREIILPSETIKLISIIANRRVDESFKIPSIQGVS